MAIKIYEQFAPFANPADGDYPYGSIKNDSIPGAEDGTPLDADWGNDLVGFTDALLAEAGIVPNGQPDKLGASQRVDAIKSLNKESSKITKSGETLDEYLSRIGALWDPAVSYSIGDECRYGGLLYTATTSNTNVAPSSDYSGKWELSALQNGYELAEQNYPKRVWSNRLSLEPTIPTVVITGDSLSYNHQDFDSVPRQNAEDCYPGMNSWSFVIRDALIRSNRDFKHSDEVQYLMSGGMSNLGPNSTPQFRAPFNGRLTVFRATSQSDSLKLYYRHTGPQSKIYLWFLKNPSDSGCSFKILVNGSQQVAAWNTGGTTVADPYQGMELHFVEVPNVPNSGAWSTIELTDFIGTAAAPHAINRDIHFMGISSELVVVKQTGRGGQSSKWLADNLNNKVTQFAPDLAIITIGANDAWAGNPQGLQTVAQYIANLTVIFDGIESANSNARIIMISPPLTNESVVPNITMQQYIRAAKRTCFMRGVAFIDAPELFKNAPESLYRFDSIHYTKQGCTMLANRLADILCIEKKTSLDCTASYGAYPLTAPVPTSERNLVTWNGSAFTLTKLKRDKSLDVVSSVAKINDYTVEVAFNVGVDLYRSIDIVQFDANGLQKITVSPQNYFNERIRYQLRKQDGSQLVAGDWTTYQSSIKFIISVS